MVSGFFLHIKCGGGGRGAVRKSRQPEAAGLSRRDPRRHPRRAPQRSSAHPLLASRCHSPRPQKEHEVFQRSKRESASGSGARSPGSVAPAAEKFCHGQNKSEAPSHRRLERTASGATSQLRPPAGPTPRGGTRQGHTASSPPPAILRPHPTHPGLLRLAPRSCPPAPPLASFPALGALVSASGSLLAALL